MDPLIKDKICSFIPNERLERLKQVNQRGGSLHRRAEGNMSKVERSRLMKGKFFRSNDVVAATNEISSQLKTMKDIRDETFTTLDDKETMKENITNESRAIMAVLLEEKEKLMETKRDLEFEIDMLEEQNQKVDNREQKRLDSMQHKIEVCIMNQDKIKKKSKCPFYAHLNFYENSSRDSRLVWI